MAACKNLQHIFDTPLPDNQTLLGSLPKINPEESSFSELFGELYFKDTSVSSSSVSLSISYDHSSFPTIDSNKAATNEKQKESRNSSKSESLHLCTEGLGFESFDDIEELQGEMVPEKCEIREEKTVSASVKDFAGEAFPSGGEVRRPRMNRGVFPPPLSFMGKSGKPGVCFKSYREDGRFVLKEVRIPTQEFLQARREHGRLKLQFIQPNDTTEEEDERVVEESEKYEEEEDDD